MLSQDELLHRADERREPFRADRYDIHTPDLAATVVQARALFRALSPGQPTLVSFRIMENGLIGYEATKGELPDAKGPRSEKRVLYGDNRFAITSALVGRYSLTFSSSH